VSGFRCGTHAPQKDRLQLLAAGFLGVFDGKYYLFFLFRDQLIQAPWLVVLSWLRCDAAAAVLVLLARLGC
jgi:hypothetical protein